MTHLPYPSSPLPRRGFVYLPYIKVVEFGTYDELASKEDGHFRRLVQYQMLA